MSLLPINLNLLRSLDVVLEMRNLTLAAKTLGLTQSALSRQLAQLREQLGDPLLIREGQRYLLTERAALLRAPLKLALANMESVLELPTFDPVLCTREFSLCGSDYIADYMLPELMRTLAPLAPGIRIKLRMWGPEHYRLLTDDGVDLVPTIADAVPENLHGRSLGQDRPVCVMRADHPLAKIKLSVADYIGWPHARVSGGGDKDSFLDQYLAAQGMQRDIRLTVPFISSALRIIINNDFLLTLPEHIAIESARQAAVIWQPLPFEVKAHQYWLLWHARSHQDAAHKWFRDQVVDVLQRSMHGVTQFNRS